MIAYLCDGRVDVIETINGANILTLNRTEKKAKSRDFFGREKNRVSLPENIQDANTDKSGTPKKGKPEKVHLDNLIVDHRFALPDHHLHG